MPKIRLCISSERWRIGTRGAFPVPLYAVPSHSRYLISYSMVYKLLWLEAKTEPSRAPTVFLKTYDLE